MGHVANWAAAEIANGVPNQGAKCEESAQEG